MNNPAKILVFDSGLGGLTVLDALQQARPHDDYIYLADDAVFPYGRLQPDALVARVEEVLAPMIAAHTPDIAVIACNTASTLVLPHLRARWPDLPFVGTVPAIKPAAEQSRSRLITVLATPATVTRDYTQTLIRDHAAHCLVTLVGSDALASLAEAHMQGQEVSDEALARELAACFIETDGARTDHIVLACTHYPLLLERFQAIAGVHAGWPVTFVDPAPAIARRTAHVLAASGAFNFAPGAFEPREFHGARWGRIIFTSARAPQEQLVRALQRYRLRLET